MHWVCEQVVMASSWVILKGGAQPSGDWARDRRSSKYVTHFCCSSLREVKYFPTLIIRPYL